MNSRPLAILMLRFALVCTLAFPLSSQDSDQPYFSLTSNQSFAPGEEPFVQVSAVGLDALRIRVYRINDPVQFMRQIGDPHQFGGTYGVPHGKLTLLERLHNWKRELRRDIRADLRSQFTEPPSQHLSFLRRSAPRTNKATYFAEAPVLNQRQLVLSFIQPVTAKANRWDTEQVKIPVKDKGVFLVEAVHQNLRAYTILSVSDLALMSKTGRDHVLYYVANRKTGEPIANASVTTLHRGESGTTMQTDQDGIAEFTIDKTPQDDLRVVAVSGRDAAFNDVESWFLRNRERNLTGVVYTDRPVYRPGDKMHFRGILRYQQSAGYMVPSNEAFSVQIMDRDGKAVYQKSLATNSAGVLHDELTLEKDAPLGSYYIQVTAGEMTVSGNFEVQEYKKPEYEVHVTPEARHILQGQSTKVTIDSRYYFGEPVTNAKVKYSIYRSRYWWPLWDDQDDNDEESNEAQPNDYGENEQTKDIAGQLDSDGKLVITVQTDVSDKKFDMLYRIEAGVTDQAGREISGTGWVIATYGTFGLNVQPDRWFYKPGDTGAFKITARDYDNRPVATPVHLEIRPYDYWRDHEEGTPVSQSDTKTGPDGASILDLKLPPNGGDFVLVASAPSAGRTVERRTWLWITGFNPLWGETSAPRPIQIVPDKKLYHSGDIANVMIAAGGENTPVLVTVEGRDVGAHRLLRSKGGTVMFSYAMTAANEPGLFVTAQYFCDGKLYQNTKRIKVPPDDHKLDIKLATDKPQYQPGQPATYDISVTTADGKPAAQTDLSLGVVDEAIYAIAKDNTPDLLDVFYGRDYNSVQSIDSLNYYFSGEAGTRRMQLAALRPATRLAQLKPEQLVRPKTRKYFPDTTFWASDITTDTQGHAKAQLSFPDSLTTWRATARGASLDDRYGSAVLKTIVRKNLIVRLAVPRFFVRGDEVVISAIVHNYLQAGKQARVSVKLEGLDILSGASTQDVSVPQRGEVKIDWRVKANQLAKAKIDAEALTNEESDALEAELPINPPGVLIRDPRSGSIANSGTTTFALAFPQTAVSGSRAISIRLSPSIAGSIFSALDYLTSFPYGCVEQTMSSFLPDIVVTQAMHELNLKQPIDQAQLGEKVQAGLDRLSGFHHEDGGWGWWTTDESHPFMTAYVVAGIAQARAAGIGVDNSEIDSGARWIERYLRNHRNIAADLRAYMVYALAVCGHPDAPAMEEVYAAQSDLSSYGLAFLGLTLQSAQDNRASGIASKLEQSVKQDASEASWPASRDEMLDFSADITPETTAFVTKFLSKERPQSPLLSKAALWLVDHRNEGFWWNSTKETAMVIYGLIDYVKASNELHPDLKATVLVNGQPARSADFTGANPSAVNTITLDESKLQPSAANSVQIQSKGSGRLYYSVSADYYSQEPKAQDQGTIALNIVRGYYRLIPSTTVPIVYDLQPLNGPVSQGDVIAVRLTVTGSDWRYLLIEDPIPAGTEFVKDDNLFHLREKPPWWQYWFTERENHDNRIAIFDQYFYRGQTEYFYLLKVVNPGLFHINPARVQPMYQPGYQATTAATTLEVR